MQAQDDTWEARQVAHKKSYREWQQEQAQKVLARIKEAEKPKKPKRGPLPKAKPKPVKKLTELKYIGRQVSSPNTVGKVFKSLDNLANKPLTKTTFGPRNPKTWAAENPEPKVQCFPSCIDFSQEKRLNFELEPRRDSFLLDVLELIESVENQENKEPYTLVFSSKC